MMTVPSLGDFSIGWRMQRRLLTGYRQFLLLPMQKAYDIGGRTTSSLDD
jgi:hypothetical protein